MNIVLQISITAIMSKLEQVKSYLQEAQALHQQMKERLSEPGMAVQVNKMGRLVEDLRRQESGYLSILVKLLDQQKGGPLANSSQERTAETDGTYSREVLSDGEVSGELADEVGGEKRDDSMSLKAELLKERMETQREEKEKQELRMLREQRDLLTKLVEQQKQIEALEVRQRRLLDGNTTGHPPATTKTQAPPSEAGVLRNGAGQEKRQARVTTENMDDETTESAVVRRLQELRERRARVEHLTSLLAQLQTDTENERESQVPTSSAVAAAGNTGQQPLGGAGSGELVAAGSQAMPAELLELHQKLRQAQEAREKLAELQQMISLLQEPDVEGSEVTQDPPLVSSSRQGLLTRESQFEQQQQQQHRGEEEEEDERWTD
ncbi:Pericentriolar material 1 protein [Geodia barretti]|uniref:Pericentriolar material 1 protein n=1 Tax=Geodia barretti TaxID=519541 RepID=A0AA35RNW5_GEOBA|nr:Pericentriolar material 1 protein [Geodia barretti]